MTGVHCSIIMTMSFESFRDSFKFGTLRNSVYETGPVTDKIGVAFGTYISSERLIVTIEDLLSGEFCLNDLCVVGRVRSLSHSLNLLEKTPGEEVRHVSLFARTESFFSNEGVASGVGSKGRPLETLKSLMEKRRICGEESKDDEYHIDCPELKKQIDAGNLTLFVCTNTLDLLVPALRILIRRSSFNVQSHEFRR